jgi:hypothetical protein
MSDFFRVFLREDARKLGLGTESGLFLGAFGKHPGWDDHIEEDERTPDLGLRTESLVRAKALLYVQGIANNISSGAWEKLDGARRLQGFSHFFLWQANEQFILGRLWSSSDGKGRTRYPMVLAAHGLRVPLSWALEFVAPHLERLREQCASTRNRAEVAAHLDQARRELRQRLAAGKPSGPPTDLLARFTGDPQFGPRQEGLFRVLYQVQQQCAAFAPGQFNPRQDTDHLRSQDLRVPAAGRNANEIFTPWTRLLRTQVDAAAPLLLLWPVAEPWLDIVLGEPTPEQMFCLCATPATLPCVSEIPFAFDETFRSKAQATLLALAQDKPANARESFANRFFGSLFKGR